MAQCNYCRTSLGCSCQRRVASDGTSCCSVCISGYENKIRGGKKKSEAQPKTAPTGVQVFYKGPGVQIDSSPEK